MFTLKNILVAALTVGSASTAFASIVPPGANDGQEFLTLMNTTDLGGGLYGYQLGIYSTRTGSVAYAAELHLSSSSIQQVKAFGSLAADRESQADNYSMIPGSGYVKSQDTWIYSPFGFITSFYGGDGASPSVQTATDFTFSVGSGSTLLTTGNVASAVPIAYVVAGSTLNYEGRVSYFQNGNTQIGSFTAVPEPATLGLAGIAAAGLLGRRRRIA